MRPLTDTTPKPLLRVGGKPLIQYHVENLVAAGFRELVINVSWLGDQILSFLQGEDWGCRIHWSREETPLETAGGIVQALAALGDRPFALVNGDIWTDYPLQSLSSHQDLETGGAHLVLVDNPAHHSGGDFFQDSAGFLRRQAPTGAVRRTYSGIAVFHPVFFSGCQPGKQALLPLLERAMQRQLVRGEHFRGQWEDVGTPERLQVLDARLGIH
jgi:MurNAc alpha-1-phosphate uridylyltransferase